MRYKSFLLSSVVGLFFCVLPSTIFLAIRTIVINSAYGAPWWALTHVRIKRMERQPFIAYRDASSAIIWIFWIFGVQASLFH